MNIIKDTLKSEENYKQQMYDSIEEIISKNTKLINEIQKVGREMNIDVNIPNIGITLNNKLNEISQEFKTAGISMFVQEKNGLSLPSYVGTAIMEDITSKVSDSIEALSKYDSSAKNAVDKRTKGPIRKLLFYASNIFKSTPIVNEKESKEITSHLSEYVKRNNEIYKYNLRDNIVPSIEKRMLSERDENKQIGVLENDILEQEVEPTLRALGLKKAIPQLRENLNIKEEQPDSLESSKSWDLKNWKIDIEEFRKETEQISQNSIKNDTSVLNEETKSIDTEAIK